MSTHGYRPAAHNWTTMQRRDFDRETAPEQVSLFEPTVELVKPAPGPQLDLFSGEAE